MYQQPTAPASVGGVLDNGFKLFSACFSQVFGLAILAGAASEVTTYFMLSGMDTTAEVPAIGGSILLAFALMMFFSLWIYGAIVVRVNGIHTGQPVALGEAFSKGLKCTPGLLVCFLCYGFALTLGTIAFIVPGIIFGVSLVFAPYILVIEGASGFSSLKKSHKLIWGNWWRTAAIIGVAGFILMVAYFLVAFVAGFAVAVDPEAMVSTNSPLQSILIVTFTGVVSPLFYSMTMAAYYDLKLRREGDDLATRIDSISAPA